MMCGRCIGRGCAISWCKTQNWRLDIGVTTARADGTSLMDEACPISSFSYGLQQRVQAKGCDGSTADGTLARQPRKLISILWIVSARLLFPRSDTLTYF